MSDPVHPGLRKGLLVYWKDEGENDAGNPVGPVTVIDSNLRDEDPHADGLGIPYFDPERGAPHRYEPDWLLEMEWMTADEAAGIAKWCGTELQV